MMRLPIEQKALVKDYDILKQAITKYKNLVVVQPVIEQIRELGGVENVTLDSKTAIQAAIQAYNSLTGEQQELVTNYDVLEALAAAYDLLAAVDRVIRMIDAIGVVSQASGSQIQQARAAYDALTVEQPETDHQPFHAGKCGGGLRGTGKTADHGRYIHRPYQRKPGIAGEPAAFGKWFLCFLKKYRNAGRSR